MTKKKVLEVKADYVIVPESILEVGSWEWLVERFEKSSERYKENPALVNYRARMLLYLDTFAKDKSCWISNLTSPSNEDMDMYAAKLGYNDYLTMANNHKGNMNAAFKSFVKDSVRIPGTEDVRCLLAFLVQKLIGCKAATVGQQESSDDMWNSFECQQFRDNFENWKKARPAEWKIWEPIRLVLPRCYEGSYECMQYYENPAFFKLTQLATLNLHEKYSKIDTGSILKKHKESTRNTDDPMGYVADKSAYDEMMKIAMVKQLAAEKLMKVATVAQSEAGNFATRVNEQGQRVAASKTKIKVLEMIGQAYADKNGLEFGDFCTHGEGILQFVSEFTNVKVPDRCADMIRYKFPSSKVVEKRQMDKKRAELEKEEERKQKAEEMRRQKEKEDNELAKQRKLNFEFQGIEGDKNLKDQEKNKKSDTELGEFEQQISANDRRVPAKKRKKMLNLSESVEPSKKSKLTKEEKKLPKEIANNTTKEAKKDDSDPTKKVSSIKNMSEQKKKGDTGNGRNNKHQEKKKKESNKCKSLKGESTTMLTENISQGPKDVVAEEHRSPSSITKELPKDNDAFRNFESLVIDSTPGQITLNYQQLTQDSNNLQTGNKQDDSTIAKMIGQFDSNKGEMKAGMDESNKIEMGGEQGDSNSADLEEKSDGVVLVENSVDTPEILSENTNEGENKIVDDDPIPALPTGRRLFPTIGKDISSMGGKTPSSLAVEGLDDDEENDEDEDEESDDDDSSDDDSSDDDSSDDDSDDESIDEKDKKEDEGGKACQNHNTDSENEK